MVALTGENTSTFLADDGVQDLRMIEALPNVPELERACCLPITPLHRCKACGTYECRRDRAGQATPQRE